MKISFPCPECGGELEQRAGRIPSRMECVSHSVKSKSLTKYGNYFHCTICGKDFTLSLALIQVNLKRMKRVKAYV